MKKILVTISFLMVSFIFGQVKEHVVQPKETVYGISRTYGISQAELKKANPFLSNRGLQIGDVLVIPNQGQVVSAGTNEVEKVEVKDYEDDNFYYRVIKPKETLYRLSKDYNTSQATIKSLNSYIEERGLQPGDVVRIPKAQSTPKQSTTEVVKNTPTPDGMYEVKAGDTVYSIAKDNKLSVADIYAANKGVQTDGLRIGSYIKIPKTKAVSIEKNKFKHTVKEDETIFSLMRKYDVSMDELLQQNPELSNGLKAGMVLNIPMQKGAKIDEAVEVKGAEEVIVNRADAAKDGEINLAWMLPLFLDKPNGKKGERDVAKQFYMGAQLALDELVKGGKKINVKVVDVKSNQALDDFYGSPEFAKYDAIVGPFFLDKVEYSAQKLKKAKTPIFSPIVTSGKLDEYDNVYITTPRDAYAEDIIGDEILAQYKGQIIKILTTKDEKSVAEAIAEKINKKHKDAMVSIVYSPADLALREEKATNNGEETVVYTPEIAVLASESSWLGKKFVKVITEQPAEYITGFSVYFVPALDVFDGSNKNIEKLKEMGFVYTATRMINSYGKSEKKTLAAFKNKYCQTPSKYMAIGYDVVYDVVDRMDKNGNLSDFDLKRTETRLSSKIGYQKVEGGKAKVNKEMRIIRLKK